jgi:PAS domain S-box-containing protein
MKSTIERLDIEEPFKMFGESAAVGMCIMQGGKFCCFNSSFPIATGYTVDELIGKDSLEIVAPEDTAVVRENTIKMLKGELSSPYQFRVIHKDGRVVWIMATVKSIQYHGKRAILGSYMEVTERKQAEERIRESETRYRLLAENAEDVIWTVDVARPTRLTYISPSVARLLGYSVEESMDKEIKAVFTPASFDIAMKAFAEEMAGEHSEQADRPRSKRLELQLRHKNGSLVDVEVNFSLIPGADGQKGEILAVARDVTAAKRMQEALGESEARYKELADSVTDVFFAMDKHLRYTYWNRASEILTGIRAEDAIGKSLRQIFADTPGIREAEKAYRSVLKTHQPETFVSDYGDRLGSHHIFEISAYPSRNGISVFARDTTERKQAEEARTEAEERLRASEQKYRLLFETSPDCIAQVDREGRCLAANPAMARSLRVPLEELIGKTISEVVPQDVAQHRLKMGRKALDRWETQIFDDERSGKYFHNIVIPMKVSEQKEAVQVITSDITEREQAMHALRESEERYRSILDEMEEGYYEVDLAGGFTFVNDAMCRILGYSRDELIGMNYKTYTPAEEVKRVFQAYNRVYRTREPLKWFPMAEIRKDATRLLVEDSVLPITNGKGKVVGFRGISRDVTERKRMEEALRDNERKLRLVSENSRDIICLHGPDEKYVYVSPACRQILGYEPDELTGTNPWELVHPEDLDAVQREGQQKASHGMPVLLSYRIRKKSGEYVWFESVSQVLRDDTGNVSGFVTSSRDITERKRAEEALRQSEERYRTILEEMGDGYFETDLAGNLTFANDALINLLGYSREEVTGKNFRSLRSKEEAEAVFKAYNRIYETGEPLRNFPSEIVCRDGRHVFAETSAFPIRNDKGEIMGFRGVRHDITERRKAEAELNRTRAQLASAVQMAHLGPWEYDVVNDLFIFNDAFYELFRTSAKEVGGYTMSSSEYARRFVHPEDAHLVAEEVRKALETDDPNFSRQLDHRIIYSDGGVGHVSVCFFVIKDEAGHTVRTYGVNQDITERKQAEEALRHSEERYRTILEEMEDSYFEVDLGGHLTFLTSAVCRDLGYSREELIGKSYKDFTVQEDVESLFGAFSEVYRTGVPNKGFPWKTIRKDGAQGFVEASISPVRNDKGEIIRFRGVGRDITERKRAEEKLRQSEENYRTLFNSSVIGTIVLDAKTMRVVMANQAAARIFGFSSLEEVRGTDPLEFVHPEDREEILEVARRGLIEGNPHQTRNLRAITKDGREIWISAMGARITHEGRSAGLISFADITEQKLQNDKLLMADRLASIGELAAGAAHELNNPLASIIGLSELLMEKNTPDCIRRDLAMIRDEARRAANVTSNLLTFAQKHRPAKHLTQINTIIEDVLKLRAYAHKLNHIEVERLPTPDLPEMLVDPFQMQQVFLNIVINAEYFMIQANNRGKLTVTTERRDGSVKVSFTDDGPGIPPQNLRRIFDPFFTTKEAGRGTGLGLSICHGIVSAHGGRIYARSQPGKGATISIELPIDGSNHVEVTL